ncbi:MAG TPA: hypothetical protein VIX84_16325, partial [Acidimicrobiales bacterium]
VLGRYDEAERYFEEADELNRRGAMRYAEALTNMWWGRVLVARGGVSDGERADRLLENARRQGKEHGYTLVESRAATAQRA